MANNDGRYNGSGLPMFHLRRIGPPATKPGVADIMDFYDVTTMIGKSRQSSTYVIDSACEMRRLYISRNHARVVIRTPSNDHKLYDDSLNGMFINNLKIVQSVVLSEGDRVTFGHPRGEKVPGGTRKLQPESEYQFLFEKCNCPGQMVGSNRPCGSGSSFAVPEVPVNGGRSNAKKRDRNTTQTLTTEDVLKLKEEYEQQSCNPVSATPSQHSRPKIARLENQPDCPASPADDNSTHSARSNEGPQNRDTTPTATVSVSNEDLQNRDTTPTATVSVSNEDPQNRDTTPTATVSVSNKDLQNRDTTPTATVSVSNEDLQNRDTTSTAIVSVRNEGPQNRDTTSTVSVSSNEHEDRRQKEEKARAEREAERRRQFEMEKEQIRNFKEKEDEKERKKRERYEQKKKDKINLIIHTETKLVEMDKEIKKCLTKDSADVDKCLAILDDLDSLPVNLVLLKRNPEIMKTVKTIRKFKGSDRIREKAGLIYQKFRAFFLTTDMELGTPIDEEIVLQASPAEESSSVASEEFGTESSLASEEMVASQEMGTESSVASDEMMASQELGTETSVASDEMMASQELGTETSVASEEMVASQELDTETSATAKNTITECVVEQDIRETTLPGEREIFLEQEEANFVVNPSDRNLCAECSKSSANISREDGFELFVNVPGNHSCSGCVENCASLSREDSFELVVNLPNDSGSPLCRDSHSHICPSPSNTSTPKPKQTVLNSRIPMEGGRHLSREENSSQTSAVSENATLSVPPEKVPQMEAAMQTSPLVPLVEDLSATDTSQSTDSAECPTEMIVSDSNVYDCAGMLEDSDMDDYDDDFDETIEDDLSKNRTEDNTREIEVYMDTSDVEDKTELVSEDLGETENVSDDVDKTENVSDDVDKTELVSDDEDKTELVSDDVDKTELVSDDADKTELVSDDADKTATISDRYADPANDPDEHLNKTEDVFSSNNEMDDEVQLDKTENIPEDNVNGDDDMDKTVVKADRSGTSDEEISEMNEKTTPECPQPHITDMTSNDVLETGLTNSDVGVSKTPLVNQDIDLSEENVKASSGNSHVETTESVSLGAKSAFNSVEDFVPCGDGEVETDDVKQDSTTPEQEYEDEALEYEVVERQKLGGSTVDEESNDCIVRVMEDVNNDSKTKINEEDTLEDVIVPIQTAELIKNETNQPSENDVNPNVADVDQKSHPYVNQPGDVLDNVSSNQNNADLENISVDTRVGNEDGKNMDHDEDAIDGGTTKMKVVMDIGKLNGDLSCCSDFDKSEHIIVEGTEIDRNSNSTGESFQLQEGTRGDIMLYPRCSSEVEMAGDNLTGNHPMRADEVDGNDKDNICSAIVTVKDGVAMPSQPVETPNPTSTGDHISMTFVQEEGNDCNVLTVEKSAVYAQTEKMSKDQADQEIVQPLIICGSSQHKVSAYENTSVGDAVEQGEDVIDTVDTEIVECNTESSPLATGPSVSEESNVAHHGFNSDDISLKDFTQNSQGHLKVVSVQGCGDGSLVQQKEETDDEKTMNSEQIQQSDCQTSNSEEFRENCDIMKQCGVEIVSSNLDEQYEDQDMLEENDVTEHVHQTTSVQAGNREVHDHQSDFGSEERPGKQFDGQSFYTATLIGHTNITQQKDPLCCGKLQHEAELDEKVDDKALINSNFQKTSNHGQLQGHQFEFNTQNVKLSVFNTEEDENIDCETGISKRLDYNVNNNKEFNRNYVPSKTVITPTKQLIKDSTTDVSMEADSTTPAEQTSQGSQIEKNVETETDDMTSIAQIPGCSLTDGSMETETDVMTPAEQTPDDSSTATEQILDSSLTEGSLETETDVMTPTEQILEGSSKEGSMKTETDSLTPAEQILEGSLTEGSMETETDSLTPTEQSLETSPTATEQVPENSLIQKNVETETDGKTPAGQTLEDSSTATDQIPDDSLIETNVETETDNWTPTELTLEGSTPEGSVVTETDRMTPTEQIPEDSPTEWSVEAETNEGSENCVITDPCSAGSTSPISKNIQALQDFCRSISPLAQTTENKRSKEVFMSPASKRRKDRADVSNMISCLEDSITSVDDMSDEGDVSMSLQEIRDIPPVFILDKELLEENHDGKDQTASNNSIVIDNCNREDKNVPSNTLVSGEDVTDASVSDIKMTEDHVGMQENVVGNFPSKGEKISDEYTTKMLTTNENCIVQERSSHTENDPVYQENVLSVHEKRDNVSEGDVKIESCDTTEGSSADSHLESSLEFISLPQTDSCTSQFSESDLICVWEVDNQQLGSSKSVEAISVGGPTGESCPADVSTDHLSTDVSTGVSTDVSTGVSTDVSTGVSTDVSTGVSTDVSTGVSTDVSAVVSANVSTGVSMDVSTGVSAVVSADVSTGVSMDVSSVSANAHVSTSMSTNVSEDVLTHLAVDVSAGVKTTVKEPIKNVDTTSPTEVTAEEEDLVDVAGETRSSDEGSQLCLIDTGKQCTDVVMEKQCSVSFGITKQDTQIEIKDSCSMETNEETDQTLDKNKDGAVSCRFAPRKRKRTLSDSTSDDESQTGKKKRTAWYQNVKTTVSNFFNIRNKVLFSKKSGCTKKKLKKENISKVVKRFFSLKDKHSESQRISKGGSDDTDDSRRILHDSDTDANKGDMESSKERGNMDKGSVQKTAEHFSDSSNCVSCTNSILTESSDQISAHSQDQERNVGSEEISACSTDPVYKVGSEVLEVSSAHSSNQDECFKNLDENVNEIKTDIIQHGSLEHEEVPMHMVVNDCHIGSLCVSTDGTLSGATGSGAGMEIQSEEKILNGAFRDVDEDKSSSHTDVDPDKGHSHDDVDDNMLDGSDGSGASQGFSPCLDNLLDDVAASESRDQECQRPIECAVQASVDDNKDMETVVQERTDPDACNMNSNENMMCQDKDTQDSANRNADFTQDRLSAGSESSELSCADSESSLAPVAALLCYTNKEQTHKYSEKEYECYSDSQSILAPMVSVEMKTSTQCEKHLTSDSNQESNGSELSTTQEIQDTNQYWDDPAGPTSGSESLVASVGSTGMKSPGKAEGNLIKDSQTEAGKSLLSNIPMLDPERGKYSLSDMDSSDISIITLRSSEELEGWGGKDLADDDVTGVSGMLDKNKDNVTRDKFTLKQELEESPIPNSAESLKDGRFVSKLSVETPVNDSVVSTDYRPLDENCINHCDMTDSMGTVNNSEATEQNTEYTDVSSINYCPLPDFDTDSSADDSVPAVAIIPTYVPSSKNELVISDSSDDLPEVVFLREERMNPKVRVKSEYPHVVDVKKESASHGFDSSVSSMEDIGSRPVVQMGLDSPLPTRNTRAFLSGRDLNSPMSEMSTSTPLSSLEHQPVDKKVSPRKRLKKRSPVKPIKKESPEKKQSTPSKYKRQPRRKKNKSGNKKSCYDKIIELITASDSDDDGPSTSKFTSPMMSAQRERGLLNQGETSIVALNPAKSSCESDDLQEDNLDDLGNDLVEDIQGDCLNDAGIDEKVLNSESGRESSVQDIFNSEEFCEDSSLPASLSEDICMNNKGLVLATEETSTALERNDVHTSTDSHCEWEVDNSILHRDSNTPEDPADVSDEFSCQGDPTMDDLEEDDYKDENDSILAPLSPPPHQTSDDEDDDVIPNTCDEDDDVDIHIPVLPPLSPWDPNEDVAPSQCLSPVFPDNTKRFDTQAKTMETSVGGASNMFESDEEFSAPVLDWKAFEDSDEKMGERSESCKESDEEDSDEKIGELSDSSKESDEEFSAPVLDWKSFENSDENMSERSESSKEDDGDEIQDVEENGGDDYLGQNDSADLSDGDEKDDGSITITPRPDDSAVPSTSTSTSIKRRKLFDEDDDDEIPSPKRARTKHTSRINCTKISPASKLRKAFDNDMLISTQCPLVTDMNESQFDNASKQLLSIENKTEGSAKKRRAKEFLDDVKAKLMKYKTKKRATPLSESSVSSQETPGEMPAASSVQRRILTEAEVSNERIADYLTRCKEVISKLRLALDCHKLRTFPRVSQWRKDLSDVEEKTVLPKTTIAVVGDTGSGKSSLMNAVIDQHNTLPTSGMRACTAVVVEVVANTTSSNYEADIKFLSRKEWFDELQMLISDLTTVDGKLKKSVPDLESEAGVAFLKVKAVYGKVDTMTALSRLTAVTRMLDNVKTIKATNPKDFRRLIDRYIETADPGAGGQFWPIVKQVTIRMPNCDACSSGAVLVDLPGVRDSNAARDRIARDYLKNCTVVWVVAAIHRAINNKTAKDMLGENFRRQLLMDGQYGSVAFICTKSDDLMPSELMRNLDLHDACESLETEIQSLLVAKKAADQTVDKLKKEIRRIGKEIKELTSDLADLKETISEEMAAVLEGEVIDLDSEGADGMESLKELRLVVLDKEESLTTIRSKRSDMEKGMDKATRKSLELEKKVDVRRKEISAICAKARNEYSKSTIKRDFKAGLREMKRKAGLTNPDEDDEMDDEDQDYNSDNDDEEIGQTADNLRVFCVSSMEYQKMKNLLTNDGPPNVFSTTEDTQIPMLRRYIHELTSSRRQHHVDRLIRTLGQFVFDVQSYIMADGTTCKGTRRDAKSAVEENSRELQEKFEPLLSRLSHDIEQIFCNSIETKMADGVASAMSSANDTVSNWGAKQNREVKADGGLHWKAYQCVVRRQGVFNSPTYGAIDFNEQLSEPMYRCISVCWDKVFSGLLWRTLEDCKSLLLLTLTVFVRELCGKLQTLEVPRDQTDRVSIQLCHSAKDKLAEMLTNLKELVSSRQRDISRVVPPTVQDNLDQTYTYCGSEAGTGMFMRIKQAMAECVDYKRLNMFSQASQSLLQELVQLKEDVVAHVRSVCLSLCLMLQAAFEPLWEAPSQTKLLKDLLFESVTDAVLSVTSLHSDANLSLPIAPTRDLVPNQDSPTPANQTSYDQANQTPHDNNPLPGPSGLQIAKTTPVDPQMYTTTFGATQRLVTDANGKTQRVSMETSKSTQVTDMLKHLKQEPGSTKVLSSTSIKKEWEAPSNLEEVSGPELRWLQNQLHPGRIVTPKSTATASGRRSTGDTATISGRRSTDSAATVFGCQSTGGAATTSGRQSTGGAATTSGRPSTDGAATISGRRSTDSTATVFGCQSTGGAATTSGRPSTDGAATISGRAATTSGRQSTGGAATTSGRPSTGGAATTSGRLSTGGAATTSGRQSTGGAATTSGRPSTGGAATASGRPSTGGAATAYGRPSTGGTARQQGTMGLGDILYSSVTNHLPKMLATSRTSCKPASTTPSANRTNEQTVAAIIMNSLLQKNKSILKPSSASENSPSQQATNSPTVVQVGKQVGNSFISGLNSLLTQFQTKQQCSSQSSNHSPSASTSVRRPTVTISQPVVGTTSTSQSTSVRRPTVTISQPVVGTTSTSQSTSVRRPTVTIPQPVVMTTSTSQSTSVRRPTVTIPQPVVMTTSTSQSTSGRRPTATISQPVVMTTSTSQSTSVRRPTVTIPQPVVMTTSSSQSTSGISATVPSSQPVVGTASSSNRGRLRLSLRKTSTPESPLMNSSTHIKQEGDTGGQRRVRRSNNTNCGLIDLCDSSDNEN